VMAPPESVVAACRIGQQTVERKCMIFGKETGCIEDYGHMDLLFGIRVQQEVFPQILKWLDEHDAAAASPLEPAV